MPSTCFIIERPAKREVFAASFRDRVVHHLYFNYTHDLFERTFISDSYSCIEGRGTHYGIKRLYNHIRQESRNYTRECYVLKFDKRGYFMHINRSKLLKITKDSIIKMSMHRICKKSAQTWADVIDVNFILWLTEVIVTLDPTKNCIIKGNQKEWKGLDAKKSLFNAPNDCGLPIGNLTSQLLSNVYLNVYDQFMKRVLGCKHYGRYVDDSYVVSSDKQWLHSIIEKVRAFLDDVLGLELNMGKLRIVNIRYGVEFLGAFLKPYRIYIANKSLQRIINSVKTLNLLDKTFAWNSINSFLGILSHWKTYNIRCGLFLTKRLLSFCYYNKGLTKMCPLFSF